MTARGAGIAWRLEVHDSLPSTADLVRRRAEAGEAEGLAVLAHQQTQGRGSRGRSWVAPPGNLNLSLLLRPGMPAARAGRFALLAGVALLEALEAFLPAGPSKLSLKWPNDLLLDGSKIAGILIDAAADSTAGLEFLAIGLGANLVAAPQIPGRPTAAFADCAPPPAPERLARALLPRIDAWCAAEATDPARLTEAWSARAHPPGTLLRVMLGSDLLTGGFAGITPEGNLLLQTNEGLRSLATGEILLA